MADPKLRIRCPSKGLAVYALATEQAPVVTGGFGGWDRIARPRRVALTDWQGSEPFQMVVSLRLDGWAQNRSIEADVKALVAMAVDRGSRTGPPAVNMEGSGIPLQRLVWVIDNLEFGDVLWGADFGQPNAGRLRQDVTITLLELVQADLVALSPAKKARAKATSKRKPGNTRGTNRGRRR